MLVQYTLIEVPANSKYINRKFKTQFLLAQTVLPGKSIAINYKCKSNQKNQEKQQKPLKQCLQKLHRRLYEMEN